MEIFRYEHKKLLFKRKGIVLILFYLTFQVLFMIRSDTPANEEMEEYKEEYSAYLEVLSGELTEDKRTLIENESEEILQANNEIKSLYEEYYSGQIEKAELAEAIEPYTRIVENEKGYDVIFQQYVYVRENPENRYFIYTNGWDALMSGENLNIVLCLLLLLIITPIFLDDIDSEMDMILLTSRNGHKKTAVSKLAVAMTTTLGICLITEGAKILFIALRYGLSNGQYPIQSLEYFSYSEKDISILAAFLFIELFRILGYLYYVAIIIFTGVIFRQYAISIVTSISMILIPFYGFKDMYILYLFPGPLGLMLGSGFFKGEMSERILSEGTVESIKEISIQNICLYLIIVLSVSLFMLYYVVKMNTNVWNRSKKEKR